MSEDLEGRLIQLGKDNRELRPHIRPILSSLKTAKIGVGETWENDVVRVHRFRDSIRVWDLENAGKRGKKVDVGVVWDLHYVGDRELNTLLDDLQKARSGKIALWTLNMHFEQWTSASGGFTKMVSHNQSTERGVDVAPAGFKPIKIETKNLRIRADYKDFSIRDKTDVYNETTCIPAIRGGKKDIKVFYRWVKDNQRAIERMTFSQLLDGMRSEGIQYHQFCAMD